MKERDAIGRHDLHSKPAMRWRRVSPLLALATILLSGPLFAEVADEPIEEIEVVGERAGPQMWKVSRDGHSLWVLGTLQPLPKRMTWRSHAVEDVLAESQQVLAGGVSFDADIGPITALRLYRQWRRVRRIPDGKSLSDVMPPALYARFTTLKKKYAPRDREIETLQPMLAAASLYSTAVDAVGLTSRNDIQRSVTKLAKKKRVPLRRTRIELEDPKALLEEFGNTPIEGQLLCLETTIARLESDVDAMKARARAWAVGDVEALRALPYPDQEAACWSAVTSAPRLKQISERASRLWFEAAEEALGSNTTTLALARMDRLLGPEGALAKFRERGYTIEGP
jgi:uncharacterized protein YbaP (TraB family)